MITKNGLLGFFYNSISSYAATKLVAHDGTTTISPSQGYMKRSDAKDQVYCALGNVLTALPTRYGGVLFGTGTTPPTLNDYTISGAAVKNLSVSVAYNETDDESAHTLEILYTITNAATVPVTIGEIAAFCGSGGSIKGALLERTVLDSPVTIPAGGVGQITYTIRMNYPTA